MKKCTKDKPPHYGHHPPYAAVCFFPGRPGGLIMEITWKGNMRVGLSDEKRKTLGVILIFLYFIYAFRSISYAFRSLHPKITKNLPIK